MKTRLLLALAAALAALACGASPRAAEVAPRKLYVANTSGDSLSVVDLRKRETVLDLKVGRHPHGLAVSPDHRWLYCSVESERAVRIIDTLTDQIVATVPCTGQPHQLAVTSDGKWVYVSISSNGMADVIEVAQRKVVKSLEVGRSPHNCYSPPGAKYMYATSIADQLVRQFDPRADHALVKTIRFDGPVRPLCVTRDEKRLFVALHPMHGFAWADLTTGKQLGRMERPLPPPEQRSKFAYMNTHGLELRPGDRELWVTSFIGNGLMVFDVTAETPAYVTTVAVGDAPNWMTFSPDGRYAYSANAGHNTITIVDCETRKAITDVKVGAVPKRLVEVHPPQP